MQTMELQRLKQEIDRLYHVNPNALVMMVVTEEDIRKIRNASSVHPIRELGGSAREIRGIAMFNVDTEIRDGDMIIRVGDVAY